METNNKDSIILNDVLPAYAVHPGSILGEELKERGIKQKDFAKSIGMEAPHLSALIHGKRNITPAIASRLESGLGIPASIWLNLQNQYNLHKQKEVKNRKPFIVDGYAGMHGSLASLREPSPIGVGTEAKIILPKSDLPLLFSLANRMGWEIVNYDYSIVNLSICKSSLEEEDPTMMVKSPGSTVHLLSAPKH